jgi:hypothetical protein
LDINLTGIVIIVGNYGSGKSETAVNLAVHARQKGLSVKITDLDLVNPYFRTREARTPLREMGIEVILPPGKYMHADLPILTPAVAGMIKNPADLTILDVGGDDVGATVLAALADALKDKPIAMLQVINHLRPFTGDVKGCLTIRREIEASSKLKITGLVSNANLIDETTPQTIYDGLGLVTQVAEVSGLDIEFITASSRLVPGLDTDRIKVPILPIDRRLAPAWNRNIS